MGRRFWLSLFFWSISSVAGAASRSDRIPVEVFVEVAEIDNSKASSLGTDWSGKIGFTIGKDSGVDDLRGDLHFLIQEGAAELLANPNLLTDSGTEATFQAGGEIPYITSSSMGSTHVEFKSYGVGLKIEPTVLKDGRIEMKIRAAVSAPDQTNGVFLSGNSVPGLSEREVTSHVTVKPGTTLTLAGLVQSAKTETIKGVPILRKIPLLGMLFRWKKKDFRRTTVVVFMTPQIKEF